MDSLKNQNDTEAEWEQKISAMEQQVLINKRRRKINDEFNSRIDKILRGEKDYRPLEFGNPAEALLLAKVPDLPIEMSVKKLIDKRLQNNHPFELLSVKNMPEAVFHPIAVFKSCSKATNSHNCKVVLTDLEEDKINFILVIEQSAKAGNRKVNTIISIYRKEATSIFQWIKNGELLYVNKEKAFKWLGKQRSNFDEITRLIEGRTRK